MSDDLIKSSAREIRAQLKNKAVSNAELLDVLETRIDKIDPIVNALPTLCFDRARQAIATRNHQDTALLGMPIAIKDLLPVAGVRTTWGSMLHEHHIPEKSDLLVERLESSGAVVYAKSNTPEFGAGANTFNDVFGVTRNPWNTALSCAGSSGGSAVALATGMAWIASGSDLGGSLRNPASFCGIVGFRPSIGRIPTNPGDMAFYRLSVEGPMARTVGDVAMLLDVMAGRDPRDPLSVTRPEQSFEAMAEARTAPKRVAFSPDLGVTPVDPEIASICRHAAQRFEDMGATRAAIYARAQTFFRNYDLLISPATIVPPYPVEQRFVEHLGEHEFSNYIEWCSIAYAITIIGAPAVSVPCGFTSTGLPVGLQIAAAPLNEGPLLSAALLFEESADLTSGVPIDPVVTHQT